MIRHLCFKYSCWHQHCLILKRSTRSHFFSQFGANAIMSSPGKRNKRKPLIQTKLSFTSASSSSGSGKLPDSDTTKPASDKGPKRKLESEDDMDPEIRRKVLEAAEKRQKHEENSKSDNSSAECPYFKDKNSRNEKADPAVASTSTNSGGQKAGDTQKYDMSGSQDLFATSDSEQNMTDSQNSAVDEDEDPNLHKKPSTWDANRPWKGKPLDKLNAAPSCLPPGLKLVKSDVNDHDICIKLPFQFNATSLPVSYPSSYHDVWDDHHVRMPCSSQSHYPVSDGNNDMKLEKRWGLITKALKGPITGPLEMEEAILSYNQRYVNKWNFTVLHHYFKHYLKPADREHFFAQVLPLMVRLALKLPYLCTQPIPLLKKGKAHKVTLSQHQIACLLANAFFCTFPRRNSRARTAEFSSYPDINFKNLFQGQPISRKMEKLNCIIHYFKRVCYDMPKGIVTFSRQVQPKARDWRNCSQALKDLHVSSAGTIEDNGIGMLQVDFANKFLGGGVLNTGCVQEEIRFMICPEMIISCLFTEVLGENESLVMTGCEQFSEYEGYADSFKWKADCQDKTPRDSMGRLCCEVVAIDALVFRNDYFRQFKNHSIIRELNKAYCGFMSTVEEKHRAAVCTGNWGCGAFGGNKQVKSLIQMMAASAAKRDMCYFTFEDEQLTKDLHKVHELLRCEKKTIGEIFRLMEDYNKEVVGRWFRRPNITLFEFIHMKLEGVINSQDSSFTSSPAADFDEDSNEAQAFTGGEHTSRQSPDYKAGTP